MNGDRSHARPIVHLELHTGDANAAEAFYSGLLSWRTERIETSVGPYLSVRLGHTIGGGIVECGTRHPLWLPYVQVDEVHRETSRAQQLGARVLLLPREGPAGWRSVVSTAAGGQLAFWQPKR